MAVSARPDDLAGGLDALARFSGPGPGVTRLVYDDAWCDAHAWLRERAALFGLAATTDAIGNLYFHDPALPRGARAIFVGSHLDTVVHGGRLDGAFGTLSGLLLAAELRGRARPVVAFVTCEEENSRFPAALTGVRGMLGQLVPDALAGQRDAGGTTWADALARARARGCAAGPPAEGRAVAPPFAAERELELHIEQGPVLERERLALGIVDRIAGYRRTRLTLAGEARHAGTTPMAMRRDALAGAAEVVLAAESLAREAGPPAVATAGFVAAEPGLWNVVPGRAVLGLEVRHVERDAQAALAGALAARVREIAHRRALEPALETTSEEPPTPLDAALADEAAALARARGVPHRVMASGAGHDSMAFAQAGVPSLMLFAPSRGGVSHSPDEHTEPGELWTVHAFARDLLSRWAGEPA